MRITNFLWKHKNGKLTKKAKSYLSKKLKSFYENKKEKYYRSLIQIRWKGHRAKSEYDFMKKYRIWINDTKTHTEQELRKKIRDVDKKLKTNLGVGIGRGSLTYDTAIELEEISEDEADNLGEFQYFVKFDEDYEYEGVI